MESTVSETSRYGFGALSVLSVLLVFAAPIYWHHTALPEVRASTSYENSDLYQFVFPAMHFAYGRLRAGEFPLWNSRQLCGVPLLADHRLGLFQPLNAVFLLSDTGRAMALHSFICLALMGFGFLLFCRSLELAYGASLIGAVVYAFSGLSAAAISRPYVATALVWVPFLFWSCREFARFGYHRWLIMGGVFAALFIFSGAYALVVLVVPVAMVYVLLHGFSGRRDEFRLRNALGGILLAGTLAVCLTAVQWVPTMMWARGLETPAKALWYLRVGGELPSSLREAAVQTFTARQGDLPRLCYVGMIPLILLPAAFFQRKHWRETLLFLVVGTAAWLMGAAGLKTMPAGLPREAYFGLSAFCCAVLAALGADRVLQPRRDYHSASVWPAALAVFAGLAGVFYMAGSQGRGYIIVFTILLAPFLLLRKAWVSVLVSCAMALLAFLDLTVANVNAYGHPYQDFQEYFGRYTESIELARERALGGRMVVSSRPLEYGLPANLGMLAPVSVVGGRNLFASREHAEWWSRLRQPAASSDGAVSWEVSPQARQPSLLNAMAARVVLASPESGLSAESWSGSKVHLREVQSSVRGRVFVNESALPRAFWVPQWRLAETVTAALDAMAETDFDPARECVVAAVHGPSLDTFQERMPAPAEKPGGDVLAATLREPVDGRPAPAITPAAENGSAPRSAASSCSLEEASPERITIHVEAPQPGIVVLGDSFGKGWRATLDGAPREILRVNGIFRGVATPQGSHDLEFTYRPPSLFVGLALSLFGVALLFGSALASACRRS